MKNPGITPGTWKIDASHSTVGFVARHLMITKVRGTFDSFDGAITIGEDPAFSSVEVNVDLGSVNTGDTGRDVHLRSADFFDVETFPTMRFVSTGVREQGRTYVVTGDLTIKGVTRPVELTVEFEGVNTDPWGNEKAAFSAETEINRKDWGLEWNVTLEKGGVLVSEKVKIQLDVQALRS